MTNKTLGFKKDKPEPINYKKLKVEGFEDSFLDYWKSLGFRKELNKDSKSYSLSIKSLRKVLGNEYTWARGVTLTKLQHYCEVFKAYSDSNVSHVVSEGDKFKDPKKMYFHQFVMTYSGYSYLRDVIQGKIKSQAHEELEGFSLEVSEIIGKKIGRKSFSVGEKVRIINFAKTMDDFYTENKHKIAIGIDKLTIVKSTFSVISDFMKLKGISPNILIFTGNFATGSALTQAMNQFSHWKIYSKAESINTCAEKDPEKARKVIAQKKVEEEEALPDVVKRRREELKKNGSYKPQQEDEDCSRREEYLRKKESKRHNNPFGRKR